MDYINRDMEKLVSDLVREYSCILLTGPRQVGKTTMFRHADAARKAVSLDDFQERDLARNDPELFLSSHRVPILIDEVQYAPELFSYIKIAIDNGAAPGSFFLTGSQSFRLMKLAQESLAGRVAVLNLMPLSQGEIYGDRSICEPFRIENAYSNGFPRGLHDVDAIGIYKRMWVGGLPAYVSGKHSNRNIFFSSYLQTYVSRDIAQDLALRDSSGFVDFIRAAACRVGCELNVHSIALDVGVSDDTASRWLGLLEKSQVIFYLHPFSNNLLKRTVKRPKLYFFDTGLVAYLTRYSSPDILMNGSINGEILENHVVSEIRKSYLNSGEEPLMYYFRDKDGKEIDLILEYDGKLHPIEIKKSSNPTQDMVRNFNVLEKTGAQIGMGAVICLKNKASMLSRNVAIVPVGAL